MPTSIRERGRRVAAGVAIGAAALALSAPFAAPAFADPAETPATAVKEAAEPKYDLESTAVMVRDASDPSIAYVHQTIVNRGEALKGGITAGIAVFSETEFEVLEAKGQGWVCTDEHDDSPQILSMCKLPGDLGKGQAAPRLTYKIKVDPNANLIEGAVSTIGTAVLDDPTNPELDEADSNLENNYALFGLGKLIKQPASLTGKVWDDANKNGLQDASEKGVKDVPVELRRGGIKVWDGKTNTNGEYKIDTLWIGDYDVKVLAPEGYKFTQTNVGGDKTVNSDVDANGVSGKLECVEDEPEVPEVATLMGAAENAPAGAKPLTETPIEVPTFCDFDIDAGLVAQPKPSKPVSGGAGTLPKTGAQVGMVAGTGALLVAGGADRKSVV